MQNLYIGPQTETGLSHLKSPGLGSLSPGTEAKPDPIKGGLQVTSFFTYNCLAVSFSEKEAHFLKAAASVKSLRLDFYFTFVVTTLSVTLTDKSFAGSL